jgi:alkanesulfonate monooxygenase SsuD/methylene tetrahydromethanopterin reductase-like flavin-dependent oxidoreductase (luciferase family)
VTQGSWPRSAASSSGGLQLGFQVWGQHASWDELMAVGRRIDELGFAGLWSNDHLLPVAGGGAEALEGERGPVIDGWMTLMGWAARTRRVTLGCLVSSVSYRHPSILVKMATALDHESGGRAVLGLGAGWHASEHRAFGFEHLPVRERLVRFEEGVRIARAMLDGEAAHVDGRWLRADGARNEPAPRQPRLPLLIGGSGEKRTLPLVARHADAWNGEGDPETYARKSALLDGLCRAAGRDPGSVRRTVGLPPPLVRARRSDAVAVLAGLLERHGLPGADARAAAESSPLVGTVDAVAARLREYRAAGAVEVMFDWPLPSDDETLVALAGPVREALAA